MKPLDPAVGGASFEAPTYHVVAEDLPSGFLSTVVRSGSLTQAVRRAREATDGGLDGPRNEVRVLSPQGEVLGRYRRLACGRATPHALSMRTQAVEVDVRGRPLMPTIRIDGEAAEPETGGALALAMLTACRSLQ
jgi:hypothetical protein